MKTLKIYDPALCCSTGVCGTDVDQNLVNMAADVDWLKAHGVQVERFNISQQPLSFAEGIIKKYLEVMGVEALPVVMVEGLVVAVGKYPSRQQLVKLFDIAEDSAEQQPEKANKCEPGAAANSCC